ncbi:MAG: tagatose 1,6-diphosphate aldolase [Anaerolineae bacterium]|nr:tagatose 1,6-diphosphate aldolase [Anaerolineae bacterium]
MTTIGKYRHLMRCSDANGFFSILAIDHRANLLADLNKHAKKPLSHQQFTAFKQEIIQAIVPESTAILTDPAYGIASAIAQHTISGNHGLLAPVEVTNYDLQPSQRQINFIPQWSVEKIKRIGGDGVKMLLPYHPDDKTLAEKNKHVQRIIDDCATHDIPFFFEPIVFSLNPDQPLSNADLLQIMVEMVKTYANMGVDVLKLQFPVDAKQSTDAAEWQVACEAISAACTIPWALLSAGVNYDTFVQQARIACQAGASGVIVGRAVWKEVVALPALPNDERLKFLQSTGKERMAQLTAICRQHATPWFNNVEKPQTTHDWFESY